MEVLWTWERMLQKTKLEWRQEMTTPENPLSKEQYIKEGGFRCIYCRSFNIIAGEMQDDGRGVWRIVTCDDCNGKCVESFAMADVGNVGKESPEACYDCNGKKRKKEKKEKRIAELEEVAKNCYYILNDFYLNPWDGQQYKRRISVRGELKRLLRIGGVQ